MIVTIIVYNRFHNLQEWLRCWPLCNHYGTELIILHTGDDPRFKQACDAAGVRYVHRKNQGLDIGAVQDVFAERLEGFPNDWDKMLWITDDVLPMSKDFLLPYVNHNGNGIAAAQISHTPCTHVRTVAYCITKELSKKIHFPADPMMTKDEAYLYEYKGRRHTLTNQVLGMGLKCTQVEPTETAGLWDTGYGKRLERMEEHYKVFPREPKSNDIHHFYHIFADGQWQEPVTEHIRAMRMGLLDQLTTFNIGIVGRRRNQTAVMQYLVEQGIFFNVIAKEQIGWEQVTQIPMHEFSKHNDGLILYAHSKGASSPSDVNIRWRRSMTYWNVIRWADAVDKLKTHDAYGSHWIYPLVSMPEHIYGNPMFAGTFFWVRSEQMRTWGKPPLTHRHEAEGWIGYKYVQDPFPLWDCTPYFPNTNHFSDGWIDNENFVAYETGVSVPAVVLHDKQVVDG